MDTRKGKKDRAIHRHKRRWDKQGRQWDTGVNNQGGQQEEEAHKEVTEHRAWLAEQENHKLLPKNKTKHKIKECITTEIIIINNNSTEQKSEEHKNFRSWQIFLSSRHCCHLYRSIYGSMNSEKVDYNAQLVWRVFMGVLMLWVSWIWVDNSYVPKIWKWQNF